MYCSECTHDHVDTPAVALCPRCGQALCAQHSGSRPGPGGTSIGCLHGRENVVLASAGLRGVRTPAAA
jgi:hypothetical protein